MTSIQNAPKIPFKQPLQHPPKFNLTSSNECTVYKQFELLESEENQSTSYSTRNSDESLNEIFTNVDDIKGVSIIDALITLTEQCKLKVN